MVMRWESKWAIAAQRGHLNRDHALMLGYTSSQIRWKVDSGEWTSPMRGHYRVAAYPENWFSRMFAAQLRTHGVACNRASAWLHCMDGFDEIIPPLELTTTRDFRGDDSLLIHQSVTLPPTNLLCGSLLATEPAWTLTDLGSVASAREIEWAVDWTVRNGWATFESLWALAKQRFDRSHHRGSAVLLDILRARLQQWTATDSILETIFLQLIRPLWIPRLVLQFPLFKNGRIIARADFACPQRRILIETLGNRFHNANRDQLTRDCERENAIGLLRGWSLYKFTWDQVVNRPTQTLRTILEIFAP